MTEPTDAITEVMRRLFDVLPGARHAAATLLCPALERERDEARANFENECAVSTLRLTELDAIEQYIDEHVPGGMCGDSVPAAAIDLLRSLLAQRDEARAQLQTQLDGNAVLRRRYGANKNETFPAFVGRLAKERDEARAECERLRAVVDAAREAWRDASRQYTRASVATGYWLVSAKRVDPLRDALQALDSGGGEALPGDAPGWSPGDVGSNPAPAPAAPVPDKLREAVEKISSCADEVWFNIEKLPDGDQRVTFRRADWAALRQAIRTALDTTPTEPELDKLREAVKSAALFLDARSGSCVWSLDERRRAGEYADKLRAALAATPPDTDTPCLTCKHGDTDACYDPCYGCCHNHVSAWEPEAKPETCEECGCAQRPGRTRHRIDCGHAFEPAGKREAKP